MSSIDPASPADAQPADASPELATLVALASAHYDANAPRVYGASLPSLGGLDPKSFFMEFFAKQVLGKAKDALADNKDDIAKAVADKTREAVEYLIDQSLSLADSIGI